jgi:VanZ family protein
MNNERAGRATTVFRISLVLMVLLLVLIAYFPFDWSPPRTVVNQVTRSTNGSLQFGEMNRARASGTAAWLPAVRTSGVIEVELEAAPGSLQADAAIMVLARDYWDTDFAIGQYHSTLLVWLRRPGSDVNGGPPLAIDRVFQLHRWTRVQVTLEHDDLRVAVDGEARLTERVPTDSLQTWGPGQIALGDEVHGGDPWRGEVRRATVRTRGHAVDYVMPGALSIPRSYLYLPDHVEPFPPVNTEQWLTALLDMLSFVLLGVVLVLARTPPARPIPATFVAATLAVVLAAGKFLFLGRHTSVLNIALDVLGGLLGALLAWQMAMARRRRQLAAGG